uniref:Uncharacterized protein n=1 Tax=Opuntia streptacantha TaxID=393608 RepID=A0A7C9EF68_OPUST
MFWIWSTQKFHIKTYLSRKYKFKVRNTILYREKDPKSMNNSEFKCNLIYSTRLNRSRLLQIYTTPASLNIFVSFPSVQDLHPTVELVACPPFSRVRYKSNSAKTALPP